MPVAVARFTAPQSRRTGYVRSEIPQVCNHDQGLPRFSVPLLLRPQPRLGRRELFDPLQARAAPHCTDPMTRLQSNMVDASFIVSSLGCFALPRVDDGAASADALQPR